MQRRLRRRRDGVPRRSSALIRTAGAYWPLKLEMQSQRVHTRISLVEEEEDSRPAGKGQEGVMKVGGEHLIPSKVVRK